MHRRGEDEVRRWMDESRESRPIGMKEKGINTVIGVDNEAKIPSAVRIWSNRGEERRQAK
jgi:hypothetical protein